MTLDFFLEHYNLEEYSIEKVYIQRNKLYIDCIMPIYLELIANGYRPSMDMTQEKTFVFHVSHLDKKYRKPYKISLDKDTIHINKENITIEESTVDVL